VTTSGPIPKAGRAGARRGGGGPAVCMIAYTTYERDARVIREAEAAARNGYRVDLITPRRKGERARETINAVNVRRIWPRPYKGAAPVRYLMSYGLFLLGCLARTAVLDVRRRYRVVHVNNMPDILVFAALGPRLRGAGIILDIHDPVPETYVAKFEGARRGVFYRLLLGLERMCAAFAHRVLTVHEPVKTDILVPDGIPAEKITVVANFPDGDVFRVVDPPVLDGPVRMIYYGTVSARFGLTEVLEAIARVRGRDRLRLRIVGDGDLAGSLKREIRDLGLEGIVDFDNRSYPLGRIPALAGAHHLGLVPYRPSPATRYMLPVKLLELTAMGIPAITVANVPIRHYFEEGSFFLYDNARIGSLTEVVEGILDRPAVLAEKRRTILRNRDKYLWDAERRKYLEVLGDLAEGGR